MVLRTDVFPEMVLCYSFGSCVLDAYLTVVSAFQKNQVSKQPQDEWKRREEKAYYQSHAPTQCSEQSVTLLAVSDFQRLPFNTLR